MNPLVSVVITTHNRAELVFETVQSVLEQTYKNIEIIVIDNESTDDTRKKFEGLDRRVRYVHKKNEGACKARNVGITLAQGEYIGFLDSDDLYLPGKIKFCVEYLDSHPNYGLVHTAAYFIDEKGQVLEEYSHSQSRHLGNITHRLLLRNYICNSTVVVRKTCFERVGLFDEGIFAPADWDMWLRLSENYGVGYIGLPLTKYRVSNNYILKNLSASKAEEVRVLEKYFTRNARDESFRGRAFSGLHLRYAQAYLISGELKQFKEEIVKSSRVYPLNLKSIFMAVHFFLLRKDLVRRLSHKIIRNYKQIGSQIR
ncbi:MAG: hypothetical protein A3D87_03330 [Omnitrophica WOR_2 bacterium RIFCSPHIGHO2_02_FULL_50_17]|nr:MAG: hypothetical protein A3D87_03330 [Omnitrophica WOR_2 bacterium RIFCSPHIGHO2_02_FULL_50_17]